MVGGIAMGLLQNSQTKKFQTSPISQGLKIAFGLMDFKVAGNDDGLLYFRWISNTKEGLARASI